MQQTPARAKGSAWTGRAPRTMNEAFGPHVSLPGERKAPYHRKDRIVMWACATAIAALFAMAALRWI